MSIRRYYPLGGPVGGGGALAVTITPGIISIYTNDINGLLGAGAEAIPTGGTGTYEYSWAQIAGTPGVVISPSTLAKQVTFTSENMSGSPVERVSTWEVTVTDGVSTPATAQIDVNFGHGVVTP